MNYFESARRNFWKNSPGTAENLRIIVQLFEPTDDSCNAFNYNSICRNLRGEAEEVFTYGPSFFENTFDKYKDYDEDSYVDNSDVLVDSFPFGQEPEFGGFYINKGKLNMRPVITATSKGNSSKYEVSKGESSKRKSCSLFGQKKKERDLLLLTSQRKKTLNALKKMKAVIPEKRSNKVKSNPEMDIALSEKNQIKFQ